MNPESSPSPEDILAQQARYAEERRSEVANQELTRRFDDMKSQPRPPVSTDREWQNRHAPPSDERSRTVAALENVRASIADLPEGLINPATRQYIKSLETRLAELPEPTVASPAREGEPYPQHPLKEEAEIGADKLNELYQREREVIEQFGTDLARSTDLESRQRDRPRYDWRKNLILEYLLPDFILSCERRAMEERGDDVPSSATHALETVEQTLRKLSDQLDESRRSPTSSGDYVPYLSDRLGSQEGSQAYDVFLLTLLCDNRGSKGSHVPTYREGDQKNRVRYYRPREREHSGYFRPEEHLGSLTPLFTRHPEVGRLVALVQEAERRTGERDSFFAPSVEPRYAIVEDDAVMLDNLVRRFQAMNAERLEEIARQRDRVTTLKDGILRLGELYHYLQEFGQALENNQQTLAQATRGRREMELDFNHLSLRRPEFWQFARRRELNVAEANLEESRRWENQCAETVQTTQEKSEAIRQEFNDLHGMIKREYGLYYSRNEVGKADDFLETENRRLTELEGFVAHPIESG